MENEAYLFIYLHNELMVSNNVLCNELNSKITNKQLLENIKEMMDNRKKRGFTETVEL